MSNGDRYERELVRILADAGWTAQRAAASGSATDRDLPDVVFGSAGYGFAGELKTVARDEVKVYYAFPSKNPEEVAQLVSYAQGLGLMPVLIGRQKGTKEFRLWAIGAADRTDSGAYVVRFDEDEHFATIDADFAGTSGYELDRAMKDAVTAVGLDHAAQGEPAEDD